MDDSEVAVIFPSKEINGNLTPPSESDLDCPAGEDEVDSPRIFLPPILDELDSSSRSIICSTSGIIDKDREQGRRKNDNEDDGYCSQDQLQPIGLSSSSSFHSPGVFYDRSHRDSILNNNLANLSHVSPSLQDVTGKVLGVSMPPNYIVRSNQQRTSFRPNLNEMSSSSHGGGDSGVYLTEIPSRHSLVDNRPEGKAPSKRTLPCDNNPRLQDCRDQLEPVRSLDNRDSEANAARRSSDHPGQSADEAGTGRSPPSRKRKGRDDEDGDDGMSQGSSEPDTKRIRGQEILPRQQPFQAPIPKHSMPTPPSQYDVQGQGNWVVQSPANCTFHIYQSQGTGGGGGGQRQHHVEWAGINIQGVTDGGLRAAFEASSKAISCGGSWKKFARMLPVSRSPSLEQDLRSLEACQGSSQEKSLAVLLRWWREECGCRHDDGVRALLKEGLQDCGLKRMARDLDRIFKENQPCG